MVSAFERAIDFVFKWEGGYSNDPRDPGGETNFGISKRAYPNEDIKNMTRTHAAELYKRDYWNVCDCDHLPPGLSLLVFDTAVNCGTKRARAWLAESLAKQSPLRAFAVKRAKHYALLDSIDDIFAGGWYARLFEAFEIAIGMEGKTS